VLEYEALTADGRFVTANAKENPDLYWALKGGGASTFAVVLSSTFATYTDLPSAGLIMYINQTQTTDLDLWWKGVGLFHSYANHFVDAGLYVYYQIVAPGILTVKPFVAINQTTTQLRATVAPLLADLDKIGLKYDITEQQYPTFFDLYTDMFDDESAGGSSLTGGWAFAKTDVAHRDAAIIDAYKVALNHSVVLVGHMWTRGRGIAPESAVNPRFDGVSDKIITAMIVDANMTWQQKLDAQHTLTHVVDDALRKAAPDGAAYVNEVRVVFTCFHTGVLY